ncbi:hypothetical protein AcV5_005864 [Taiwanofungus camphoratus]|nr:hypothetical protein AcV5_005864 [Antrodia cinnamomea]
MSKFTPSPAEVALVNQIFAQADTQKLGVITGEAAVKIFSGSKLSPAVLAEIWNLADDENNGVLTRKGVAVAVRLLGHAQRGENVTEALVNKPGPIPTIEGLTPPLLQQTTGAPSTKSPPPGFPPLTPQDKAKFTKLFIGCGPINGILNGEKARDVFVKSKLPVEKLSQIWNLADTKNRGALDAADFTIAMYLIQASMSGQLRTLPLTLPPGLYEQAGGRSPFDAVVSHATGGSGSFSPSMSGSFSGRPMSTLEPQFTGASSVFHPQMTGQLRSAPSAPPLPARSVLANPSSTFPFAQPQTTQQWDVTPSEKANADRIFDELDKQKRGFIEGDVAVPFMLKSQLPEDVLAQVWDLSDLNNDGRLTRDGFAVAMHLIQAKLGGKDIPTSLPPTLVPLSMRTPTAVPAVFTQPSVPDSIRDLIWDDTPPASATVSQPVLQPQATGTLSPRQTPMASPPPQRSQTMPPLPQDPFGSSPFSVPAAPVHKDLLGDDDEPVATSSPPLQDQSAEIGNVKIQLNSTNQSLETTKNDRANVERALSEQAAQLSALQTQLSSAKAAYETETRLLNTLRERYASQTAELQKAREELIRGESDLSAVRVEKAEIEGSVLRDKEDVRELQRKMREVGAQVEMLKAEVEKAKKDAKQQKGLLAISRKQLATREAERAKVEKELEEARTEAEQAAREREAAEAELAKETPVSLGNGHDLTGASSPEILAAAIAQPLPSTPDLSSPTGSIMSLTKSTNPFERVAMGSGPGSRAQSPFLPFANSAVLPTPTTSAEAPVERRAATPAAANPFRFSQVFNTDETPIVPETPTEAANPAPPETAATEQPVAAPSQLANGDADFMPPTDTEFFHTPMSSATPAPAQSSAPQASLDPTFSHSAVDAAVVEPPIQVPSHQQEQGRSEQQTDLGHQLKELEEGESDTDTESEDDEPLATVKAKLSHEFTDTNTNGTASTATAVPAMSAFDDSFRVTSTPEPVSATFSVSETSASRPDESVIVSSQPLANEVFGAPFVPPSASQEPSTSASTAAVDVTPRASGNVEEAGVNDFDEAMGKISASASPSNGLSSQFSQFTFDSAFDDNFDFAAASAASNSPPVSNGVPHTVTTSVAAASPKDDFDSIFMTQPGSSAAVTVPAPVPSAPSGSFEQPPLQQAKPFSFDDAFGSGTSENHLSSSQSGPRNGVHGISFDDAFGGHASDTLALDSSFISVSRPSAGVTPAQTKGVAPFPPLSPTRSESPQLTARRSTSPARQIFPPPRHSSPKPRPSTSSSDKEKAPTTRHSKLSIRLPFGRKKKTHDAPPMPPPLATQQLLEEPTPAVDDDIEAVKQLCGMGFSRTQAVTALEMHGYDFQRALNSLLGSA